MANYDCIKNVYNQCKTPCKSLRISRAKKCVKSPLHEIHCVNPHFPTHFSHLSHTLSHSRPPLVFNYFIHYSTAPTITTTKYNIIERN